MNRFSRLLLAAFLVAAGCQKKPPQTPREPDADFNSGADAKRSGALTIEPNKPYTDNVDFDKGDRTDWKQVTLGGNPGVLTIEIHWDSPAADITVDVFDSAGTQIASSPANSGMPYKKTLVEIKNLGVYFLRVRAAKAKDASDYTLEAKWDGAAVVAPPPPVVEKEEPKPKHVVIHHEPRPAPPHKRSGGGKPEDGVQGRIVSSYREGGALVLHLDKGSSAGVSAGQGGWILEGPSGASPLEGGNFTITQVIDESRSIGKTNLKSLSKNTRISINTGK